MKHVDAQVTAIKSDDSPSPTGDGSVEAAEGREVRGDRQRLSITNG